MPAIGLKVVGLARIVNALAQGGVEFQSVSVHQDAARGNVCEVSPRHQSALGIVDLVLFQRFRKAVLSLYTSRCRSATLPRVECSPAAKLFSFFIKSGLEPL
jgi:hypothetical protein